MDPNTSQDAATLAAQLARGLSGLRDPALRVAWVNDQLGRLGAGRAADVLTVVLVYAEQRAPLYGDLLLMVSVALAGPEQHGLRRAIASLASLRAQDELAVFLREDEEQDTSDAQRVPDFGLGRPVSLGERKSLARRRDRDLLARVLRDPHPDVIGILLNNPALTEQDVVRLCALRPVSPAALRQVFLHPRWILSYQVRLALALNPHTPTPLGVQLLPHLHATDRQQALRAAHTGQPNEIGDGNPPGRALH